MVKKKICRQKQQRKVSGKHEGSAKLRSGYFNLVRRSDPICLICSNYPRAEFRVSTFNSASKAEKKLYRRVLFNLRWFNDIVISRCCFAEDGEKNVLKCTTHVQSHCLYFKSASGSVLWLVKSLR